MFIMITKLCNCLHELGTLIVLCCSLVIFDNLKIPTFLEYPKFLIHFIIRLHNFWSDCILLPCFLTTFSFIITGISTIVHHNRYSLLYIIILLRLPSGIHDECGVFRMNIIYFIWFVWFVRQSIGNIRHI